MGLLAKARALRVTKHFKSHMTFNALGVAAASSVFALAFKLLIDPFLPVETPFVILFSAVIIAGWYGGFGPALFATVLAALFANYFFIEPRLSFRMELDESQIIRWLIFSLDGIFTSLLCGSLHRSLADAEETRESAKQAQASLENQNRILNEQAQLLELAADAILIRDRDDQILFWNKSAEHLYGISKKEAIGKTTHILLQTEFPIPSELICETLASNGQWQGELKQHTRDGHVIHVMSRWSILREDNGKYKILQTHTDITKLKLAQAEMIRAKEASEQASRAKSHFLANMSHEMRTPLAAVLGFTDLLSEAHTFQENREYLEAIKRNGEQLLHLIDDLLDLTRVESGRLRVEPLSFHLGSWLSEIAAFAETQALRKNVEFKMSVSPELPTILVSDPQRLRQVLVNVIGNAIKFTDGGSVQLAVSFQKEPVLRLKFEVKDTGIGLTREQRRRLFQPFSQADASTTRRYGGTGLGLALSKRIMRTLGGDLELTSSQPGVGSVFTVWLHPFLENENRVPASPSPANSSELIRLNGLRILVAEDSSDNQRLLQKILSVSGVEVELAADGAQALALALKKPFDLILMDIQMPVTDGLTATRQLRSLGYRKPIIALSAHAYDEEKIRSLEAGCNAHLAKPLHRGELLRTIDQFTQNRKAQPFTQAARDSELE